jgi:hypothetical protein
MPCTSGRSDSLFAQFVPKQLWSTFFPIPFIGAVVFGDFFKTFQKRALNQKGLTFEMG